MLRFNRCVCGNTAILPNKTAEKAAKKVAAQSATSSKPFVIATTEVQTYKRHIPMDSIAFNYFAKMIAF